MEKEMEIMKYKYLGANKEILYIESNGLPITDPQSALDCIMTAQYETGCRSMILDKDAICEDFYKLSSGLAGEILQKFINYHIKLAIVGDFSQYTSKPLQDFMYECNKGKDTFFVDNLNRAIEKLSNKSTE